MKKPPTIHPAGTWADLGPMPPPPTPLAVFPEQDVATLVRFVSNPSGGTPAWVTDGALAIERSALAAAGKALGAYASRQANPRPPFPWAMFSPVLATAGADDESASLSGTILDRSGYVVATMTSGRQAVFQAAKAAVLAALLARKPGLRLTVSAERWMARLWDGDGRCVAVLCLVLLHGLEAKK
jgi:hypothetical protein